MIQIRLPQHLRDLANISGELTLEISGELTLAAIVSTIEVEFPMLRGTILNPTTQSRRAFIRFFADGQDISNVPINESLKEYIRHATPRIDILGAIAGG
ncbi:MoaD/ThiS family protein [Acidithrix sp. C25]|uniref:MoaD/ThiS family protein n=1 Tax=Acidithrix sp. C25 TaxID=1671482 RepID=UPI00191BA027|nr:MoaD/ThiS family protein [Acidithrix sp. C25]